MPALRQNRHPKLIAEFGTPGDARAAIEALEHHGIDGLEIQVLGDPDEGRRQPADRRALTHVGKRLAKGLVLGALIGGLAFAVVGVAFAAAGSPAGVIAALVLVGLALGAIVGAFVSVERGVGMSEDWERTFQKPSGAARPMWIGVNARAPADIVRVREVLEDHRPLELRTPS
jgi:hypothetical protein